MDPVFDDPFAGGASFDPPVDLEAAELCRWSNLVVLSHSHVDHFSPRTLALFDRSTQVLYPEDDALIAETLAALGFERARPVHVGVKLDFGDLTLYPTRSAVTFPEMGMLFVDRKGHSFWNMVDSVVDDIAVSRVRALCGRPRLVFAPFQPIVQDALREDALGSSFPCRDYGRLLTAVWDTDPHFVSPGSCGFSYGQGWFNQRAFPITERRFGDDLKRVKPELGVVYVPHGGAVELDALPCVEPGGQPFVRLRRGPHSSHDWRPERGVPAVKDTLPRAPRGARALVRGVEAWLDRRFLDELAQTEVAWLEKMARLEVLWELELVLPAGASRTRALRFAQTPLAWSEAKSDFVSLRSVAPAAAIADALEARVTAFALATQIRKASRLYGVHRGGVTPEDAFVDEPLGRVLYLGLDERYVKRELDAVHATARRKAS
jgi:hypothetical protein